MTLRTLRARERATGRVTRRHAPLPKFRFRLVARAGACGAPAVAEPPTEDFRSISRNRAHATRAASDTQITVFRSPPTLCALAALPRRAVFVSEGFRPRPHQPQMWHRPLWSAGRRPLWSGVWLIRQPPAVPPPPLREQQPPGWQRARRRCSPPSCRSMSRPQQNREPAASCAQRHPGRTRQRRQRKRPRSTLRRQRFARQRVVLMNPRTRGRWQKPCRAYRVRTRTRAGDSDAEPGHR